MSREDERHFSTADLARASEPARMEEGADRAGTQRSDPASTAAMARGDAAGASAEPLAALFQGPQADDLRHRWDAVQIGFVDDPRAAVRNADELVAQVLRTLAESFSEQRARIEQGLDGSDQSNTEAMRVALQRYRSFFQRLLSL
jgi:hypothetical protein